MRIKHFVSSRCGPDFGRWLLLAIITFQLSACREPSSEELTGKFGTAEQPAQVLIQCDGNTVTPTPLPEEGECVNPLITSLTPSTARPGQTVTISGKRFGYRQGVSKVTFNGVEAVPHFEGLEAQPGGDVLKWTENEIVVKVPARAANEPGVPASVVVSCGRVEVRELRKAKVPFFLYQDSNSLPFNIKRPGSELDMGFWVFRMGTFGNEHAFSDDPISPCNLKLGRCKFQPLRACDKNDLDFGTYGISSSQCAGLGIPWGGQAYNAGRVEGVDLNGDGKIDLPGGILDNPDAFGLLPERNRDLETGNFPETLLLYGEDVELSDSSGYVGLRRVRDLDGQIRYGITCAFCHSNDDFGNLPSNLPNASPQVHETEAELASSAETYVNPSPGVASTGTTPSAQSADAQPSPGANGLEGRSSNSSAPQTAPGPIAKNTTGEGASGDARAHVEAGADVLGPDPNKPMGPGSIAPSWGMWDSVKLKLRNAAASFEQVPEVRGNSAIHDPSLGADPSNPAPPGAPMVDRSKERLGPAPVRQNAAGPAPGGSGGAGPGANGNNGPGNVATPSSNAGGGNAGGSGGYATSGGAAAYSQGGGYTPSGSQGQAGGAGRSAEIDNSRPSAPYDARLNPVGPPRDANPSPSANQEATAAGTGPQLRRSPNMGPGAQLGSAPGGFNAPGEGGGQSSYGFGGPSLRRGTAVAPPPLGTQARQDNRGYSFGKREPGAVEGGLANRQLNVGLILANSRLVALLDEVDPLPGNQTRRRLLIDQESGRFDFLGFPRAPSDSGFESVVIPHHLATSGFTRLLYSDRVDLSPVSEIQRRITAQAHFDSRNVGALLNARSYTGLIERGAQSLEAFRVLSIYLNAINNPDRVRRLMNLFNQSKGIDESLVKRGSDLFQCHGCVKCHSPHLGRYTSQTVVPVRYIGTDPRHALARGNMLEGEGEFIPLAVEDGDLDALPNGKKYILQVNRVVQPKIDRDRRDDFLPLIVQFEAATQSAFATITLADPSKDMLTVNPRMDSVRVPVFWSGSHFTMRGTALSLEAAGQKVELSAFELRGVLHPDGSTWGAVLQQNRSSSLTGAVRHSSYPEIPTGSQLELFISGVREDLFGGMHGAPTIDSLGYRVPKLVGLRFKIGFLHDGSLKSLEDLMNADRLKKEWKPTGFAGTPPNYEGAPGHEFTLLDSPEERKALLAFLQTL